jgi:sirohydrochlorin cobaltochelatase
MIDSSAYLLVSHGSRDPRPQKAVEHLAHLLRCRLSKPEPPSLVTTATLELATIPLHERICQQVRAYPLPRLDIIPLFLSPGVHAREDIPAEVAIAQQSLPNTHLHIHPYVGSYPGMVTILADQFRHLNDGARLIVAHGSRLRGANASIEALAAQLGAITAYWSVDPSLEAQVTALVATGCHAIAIQPYFLFSGGIADAIATTVEMLQLKFPHVRFSLGQALGATPALADLIVQEIN